MHNRNNLEVNLHTLASNINNIRQAFPDYGYYIGVIKGNAYGHGYGVVPTLVAQGINYLAVSSLEEALFARAYHDEIPILIMEPILFEELALCQQHNFTITVSSVAYFEQLLALHRQYSFKLRIHLKLDTGLNRLGIDQKEPLEALVKQLQSEAMVASGLSLEGIFTHFATTGVLDAQFDRQVASFLYLTQNIDLSSIPIIHLGRSATLETLAKLPFANGIRMGAILFGISQTFRTYGGAKGKLRKLRDDYRRKKLQLSATYETAQVQVATALQLKTPVMEVNPLKAGESVGYGGTFTADQDTYIAVCPIGYADGLHLGLRHSQVAFGQQRFPIVGIINMCMITVAVDASVQVGDMLTLIGGDIDVKKIARLTATTPYVVMTQINKEIKRTYIEGEG